MTGQKKKIKADANTKIKKDSYIQIRIDKNTKEKIKQDAKEEGFKSMSQYIRNMLICHNKINPPKPKEDFSNKKYGEIKKEQKEQLFFE